MRAVVTLADGWRFLQDDKLSGAEAPGFADASWQQITVPHSWNRVGSYLPSVTGRLNTPDKVEQDSRCRLVPPHLHAAGKRLP